MSCLTSGTSCVSWLDSLRSVQPSLANNTLSLQPGTVDRRSGKMCQQSFHFIRASHLTMKWSDCGLQTSKKNEDQQYNVYNSIVIMFIWLDYYFLRLSECISLTCIKCTWDKKLEQNKNVKCFKSMHYLNTFFLNFFILADSDNAISNQHWAKSPSIAIYTHIHIRVLLSTFCLHHQIGTLSLVL